MPRVRGDRRLTDAELAWAAGFFEGEGCFSFTKQVRKDGTYSISQRLDLSQKGNNGRDLCERFRLIVGFGYLYHTVKVDMWKWACTEKDCVQRLLNLLQPWLSPRRIQRAQEIIKLQKENSYYIS